MWQAFSIIKFDNSPIFTCPCGGIIRVGAIKTNLCLKFKPCQISFYIILYLIYNKLLAVTKL
nr:MAG TPA: hypothetical protein [Bacteriophage sp.]